MTHNRLVLPAAAVVPAKAHRGAAWSVVVVPRSVAAIGEGAFQHCEALEQIDFVGRQLREIGAWAFHGCSALERVAIPEGTERICGGAFAHCNRLSEVVLPSSIHGALGQDGPSVGVFSHCRALRSVRLRAWVGANALRPAMRQAGWLLANAPFYRSFGVALEVPPVEVRTISGGRYRITGIVVPGWPHLGMPLRLRRLCSTSPQQCPDLKALLAAQHPGSEVGWPAGYNLVAALRGSADVSVNVDMPSGARLLWGGELDFATLTAVWP